MIEQEYKNHAIWANIEAFENRLEELSAAAKADERYYSAQKQVAFIKWALTESEPWLIAKNELDQINNDLTQSVNHLVNSGEGWAYFPHLSQSLTSVMQRLPYPRKKRFPRGEASSMLTDLAKEVLDLRGQLERLKTEGEQVASSFEEKKSEISHASDQFSGQFAQFENDFKQRLENALAGTISSAVAAETDLKEAAERNWTEYKSRFDAAMEELEKDKREAVSELKTFATAHENQLSEVLATSKVRLREIEGIYSLAGNTLLAGGFVQASQNENKLYEIYSRIAVGLFILGALFLATVLYRLLGTPSVSLRELFLRLPISLVVLLPGFYLASLASKHRASSIGLRSLGLRIKAFDAYLAGARDDHRDELRAILANHFFVDVQSPVPRQSRLDGKTVDGMVALLDKVISKIPGGS